MKEREIVYIKTEPVPAATRCRFVNGPNFRCTIEFGDGSTIERCGITEQHALANAIACYKTTPKARES